jgi:quinone-modifying oxidoreductase subunit QmoA
VEACPVERPNDFNFGMDKTKAIYLPHDLAFPMRYVVDGKVCKGSACAKCVEACKYGAIDLNMKPETKEFTAGSVVFATGWNPYDANKMDNLGFGKVKNVVSNMMMERLSAPNGPTKGKIVRPSDGKEVKSIAFVQCAGSRDENHLPYCSSICCMASLKQATYLREKNADSNATVFYIDLRTPGKYEDFLRKVGSDANIKLVKGKVAKIEEATNGDVIITAEDIEKGTKVHETFDMAVLATGMESAVKNSSYQGVQKEENGFVLNDGQTAGIYAAGVGHRPNDVTTSLQEATGIALKSIQSLARR